MEFDNTFVKLGLNHTFYHYETPCRFHHLYSAVYFDYKCRLIFFVNMTLSFCQKICVIVVRKNHNQSKSYVTTAFCKIVSANSSLSHLFNLPCQVPPAILVSQNFYNNGTNKLDILIFMVTPRSEWCFKTGHFWRGQTHDNVAHFVANHESFFKKLTVTTLFVLFLGSERNACSYFLCILSQNLICS